MVMNFFPSRHRCCETCCQRTVTVKGEEVTEYYHRGVVFLLVGFEIAVPLDVEMILPGEGEVIAAKRLLERVTQAYGRFFDGIVGDALYFEAPFINFCINHGKEIVVVLKGEQRALLQDAQGLFTQMEANLWEEPKQKIRLWDAEGFTSVEGVERPLRVLHAEETLTRRRRIAKKWIETTELHHWWWATTLPLSKLSSRQLWRVGHSRWEIENNLFNTLSTHWSLNHCFKHEPTAILNFILTLLIAFVLIQSFYLRNLNPQRRTQLTLISLGNELYLSLALTTSHAPWLDRGG